MDTLIVETLAWSPHLETAGEIALCERDEGKDVGFCFLHVPNPDDELPRSLLTRSGLLNRRHKVRHMERLIGRRGVHIAEQPELEAAAREKITVWVDAAPTDLASLRQYRYGEARLGAGVVASLVAFTKNSTPNATELQNVLRRYLELSASCYELTLRLIERFDPKRLITFNGRFAGVLGVAEAAQVRDVPVLYHERGSSMDRYELYAQPPQSQVFVQSEVRRYWDKAGDDRVEIGAAFYRRRRSGDGVGWFSFTGEQVAGTLPALPDGRRTIVYFTSSDDENEFVMRDAVGPLFRDARDAVRYVADWAAARDDVTLVIRIHPRLARVHQADRDWWHAIAGRNTVIVPADSPVDTYALIEAADVVLSSGSTAGLEASWWGRPSIVLAEAFYGSFGCVYEPRSVAELDALLADHALPALPQERCLPYGYYMSVFGIPFKYYKPDTLFIGRFLGCELGYEASILGLGRAVRAVRRALHGRSAAEGNIPG